MQHVTRRPVHYYSLHRGIPPPLSDPENWFSFTDKDSVGYITTHQVLFSLKASLRPKTWFEDRTVRKKLEETSWPITRNVDRNEFVEREMHNILIKVERDYKAMFNRKTRYGVDPYKNERAAFEGLNPNDPIIEEYLVPSDAISTVRNTNTNNSIDVSILPNIVDDSSKWFSHFDYEHAGILCKDDVLHGLVTTTSLFVQPSSDEEEEQLLRMYETIWDIYDVNKNDIITKHDFLANGGLADTLSSFVLQNERNNVYSGDVSVAASGSDITTVVATNVTTIERSMMNKGTVARMPNDNDDDNIHNDTNSNNGTIVNIRKDPSPPLLTKSNVEEWFNYLDNNNKNYLTKQQIISGIQFTILNHSSSSSTQEDKNQIEQSIETIWGVFTPNDNDEQIVTKTDFLHMDDHMSDSLIQFVYDWNHSNNSVV